MAQFDYHFCWFWGIFDANFKAKKNQYWEIIQFEVIKSRKSCCDSLTFHILIVAVIAHFYSISPWVNDNVQGFLIQESEKWTQSWKNQQWKALRDNTEKMKIVSLVCCFSFDKIFHFYLSSSSFSLATQSFHSFFSHFFVFYPFCCS